MHPGNVADSATLLPEVQRLRAQFDIDECVLVGDGGMIGHQAIEQKCGRWTVELPFSGSSEDAGPGRRPDQPIRQIRNRLLHRGSARGTDLRSTLTEPL